MTLPLGLGIFTIAIVATATIMVRVLDGIKSKGSESPPSP